MPYTILRHVIPVTERPVALSYLHGQSKQLFTTGNTGGGRVTLQQKYTVWYIMIVEWCVASMYRLHQTAF